MLSVMRVMALHYVSLSRLANFNGYTILLLLCTVQSHLLFMADHAVSMLATFEYGNL